MSSAMIIVDGISNQSRCSDAACPFDHVLVNVTGQTIEDGWRSIDIAHFVALKRKKIEQNYAEQTK